MPVVTVEATIDIVKKWAQEKSEIAFCYIPGSFAIGAQDRYSDFDLVIELTRSPRHDDIEIFQKELSQLLSIVIDLRFISYDENLKVKVFENGQWVDERSPYYPRLVLKGTDHSIPPEETREFILAKALRRALRAKTHLNTLRYKNAQNPHLGGLYDFLDYDNGAFLVLRSFFKFFDNYNILHEEGITGPFPLRIEIDELRKKYGRRIAATDAAARKIYEEVSTQIDFLSEHAEQKMKSIAIIDPSDIIDPRLRPQIMWRREHLFHESFIKDKKILEIAPNHCLFTERMLELGAKHIGLVENNHSAFLKIFNHFHGNSKIEVFNKDIHFFLKELPKDFDTIICAGFLYHTPHPIWILEGMANLNPRYILIDTACSPDDEIKIESELKNVPGFRQVDEKSVDYSLRLPRNLYFELMKRIGYRPIKQLNEGHLPFPSGLTKEQEQILRGWCSSSFSFLFERIF